MACSEARLAANRANATRSTGPRTPAGKLAARRNSLKHGLTGAGAVIPGEDVAELEIRTAEVVAELAAGDATTTRFLARRAAVLAIRLDRSVGHEFAATAARVRAAGEGFDRDREAEVVALYDADADAEGTDPDARAALREMPEGVDLLLADLRDLRDVAQAGTPGWTDEFGRQLRRFLGDGSTLLAPGDVVAALDGERIALEAHARTLDRAAPLARRDEACRAALVANDPDTLLARRYEAATERSLFRVLKEIRAYQDDRDAVPVPPEAAPPATTPSAARAEIARPRPAEPTTAAPPAGPSRSPAMGSFFPESRPVPDRPAGGPRDLGVDPARPRSRYEDRKKRPKVGR